MKQQKTLSPRPRPRRWRGRGCNGQKETQCTTFSKREFSNCYINVKDEIPLYIYIFCYKLHELQFLKKNIYSVVFLCF